MIECLKKAHSLPNLIRIATSLQTYYNVVSCMDLVRLFLYPLPEKKLGYIEIALSVCPDVCLADSCWPISFLSFDIDLP